MKIAILIPSRNRPRLLSSVITALHEMESGENEIEYRVGVDWDDDLTMTAAHEVGTSIRQCRENILTIGQIWNELAKPEADIYSCMIDDAFPISPHWDKEMVNLAKQFSYFSWWEASAPQNPGYPTCTKEYLKTIGYMVPEYFPYWFMDTWMQELSVFITNQPVPASQRMALYSKQEATQNFRDLSFWWGFFNATRLIRLKEACKIASMNWVDFKISRQQWIDLGNNRDREFRGERIAELENKRAVTTEPSQKYLLAKKKAEEYLVANALTLWGGLNEVGLQG